MEHGYVQSGAAVLWSPKEYLAPGVHRDSEYLSFQIFGANRLVGWRCHPCRLVLVEYGRTP